MAIERHLSGRLPLVGRHALLRDIEAKADLDENYVDGLFGVYATLRNTTGSERRLQVNIELLAPGAQTALHQEVVELVVNGNEEGIAQCLGRVPNVEKWSAECPSLYTLVVGLHEAGNSWK